MLGSTKLTSTYLMTSLCKLSRLCELNKRNFSNDKNIHILGSKDQAFHLAFIGLKKRLVQLPIQLIHFFSPICLISDLCSISLSGCFKKNPLGWN